MAATATKTNERPGTRAQYRHARMSATKARAVLDLIRNLPVDEAADVLRFAERGAAEPIGRVLASAIANAEHNDELDGESLYVSACYADEGPTLKRWRPRARGRATRIRKRTCHITIIVSPMPAEMAAKVEAKRAAAGPVAGGRRGRGGRAARESRRERVARSRGEQVTPEDTDESVTDETTDAEESITDEPTEDVVVDAEEAVEDETDVEPSEDEDIDERGIERAEGGDAEGGASTEADNDEADDSEDEPDASKDDK
jgi:large subunit ribosomal protein L22